MSPGRSISSVDTSLDTRGGRRATSRRCAPLRYSTVSVIVLLAPCSSPKHGRIMLLRKAYRFRIDPDAAQEELFRLTIGCCRLVYNLSLDQKISERERSDATLYSSKSAGLYSRFLSPQKPRTPARDALLATASR